MSEHPTRDELLRRLHQKIEMTGFSRKPKAFKEEAIENAKSRLNDLMTKQQTGTTQ